MRENVESGIFQLLDAQWGGLFSITKSGKLIIDATMDFGRIGDEAPFTFLRNNLPMLHQMEQGPTRLFYEFPYEYAITRTTIGNEKYNVYNIYCKRGTRFSKKDLKWLDVYNSALYARILKNNELIQERNFAQSVFESTGSAIIVFDAAANITFTNRATFRIVDMAPEQLMGSNYRRFMPEDSKEGFFESLNYVYQTGKTRRLNDFRFLNLDNERIYNVILLPFRTSKGKIVGVVLVGDDVTELRFMEHELEQSRQFSLLGQVAAGIAHDIKNPLANIRGCARLMGDLSAPSNRENLSNIVIHEVDRINNVVNQLLSYGNLSKETSFSMLSLNDVLSNCVGILSRQIFQKEITITTQFCAALPLIRADNVQMHRTLLNILTNAFQSIEKEGTVSVLTSFERETALISLKISDDGVGIDEAHLKRIFSPYYSTKVGGTGLGLFVAKKVIEEHGGTITIHSTAGFGTDVLIDFPYVMEVGSDERAHTDCG